MALLYISDNELYLKFSDSEGLDRSQYSIFFKYGLSSEPLTYKGYYKFVNVHNLDQLAFEIYQFLSEHRITCQSDDNVKDLIKAYIGLEEELESLKDVGAQIKQSDKVAFSPGPRFTRILKQFQIKPAFHMYKIRNCANFSVPGSGKTAVVYAAYSRLVSEKAIDNLFVIGPRSSFMPWEDEFFACFNRNSKSLRIVGDKNSRIKLYREANKFELILTSYNSAFRDVKEIIQFLKRSSVFMVLDESHNIKRLFGGQWSDAILETSPHAKKKAILTGTPMPNSLEDLWNQFEFLWPNREMLGTKDYFRTSGINDFNKVKNIISPFFVRISKSALNLPQPEYKLINVSMAKYQEQIYNIIKHRTALEFKMAPEERTQLRSWRRARIIRLLQIASNPTLISKHSKEFDVPPISGEHENFISLLKKYPRFETPLKIEVLDKIVYTLVKIKRTKVIVWTNFVHNIRTFEKRYEELNPLVVFGEIAKDDRENSEYNREMALRAFKSDKNHNLLIANPATCAESISLHKVCKSAVYYDRTFNCGQFLQSMDRIHRVGLDRRDKVKFYFLVCQGSIDQVINDRLIQKAKTMMKILDDELPVFSYYTDEFNLGDVEDDKDMEALIKHINVA